MVSRHILEMLIEAAKKIEEITDRLETEYDSYRSEKLIDDVNSVILQLDHVVEVIEKRKSSF